jgi:hypothetical protein
LEKNSIDIEITVRIKYLDYYMGTGRDKLVATNSIREAMDTDVVGISDLEDLQQRLLLSFPNDKYYS